MARFPPRVGGVCAETCRRHVIHYIYIHTHTHIYTYTGCPEGNVPDIKRMFLTLKYTDINQNTYVYPKLNGYGDNGERSLKV